MAELQDPKETLSVYCPNSFTDTVVNNKNKNTAPIVWEIENGLNLLISTKGNTQECKFIEAYATAFYDLTRGIFKDYFLKIYPEEDYKGIYKKNIYKKRIQEAYNEIKKTLEIDIHKILIGIELETNIKKLNEPSNNNNNDNDNNNEDLNNEKLKMKYISGGTISNIATITNSTKNSTRNPFKKLLKKRSENLSEKITIDFTPITIEKYYLVKGGPSFNNLCKMINETGNKISFKIEGGIDDIEIPVIINEIKNKNKSKTEINLKTPTKTTKAQPETPTNTAKKTIETTKAQPKAQTNTAKKTIETTKAQPKTQADTKKPTRKPEAQTDTAETQTNIKKSTETTKTQTNVTKSTKITKTQTNVTKSTETKKTQTSTTDSENLTKGQKVNKYLTDKKVYSIINEKETNSIDEICKIDSNFGKILKGLNGLGIDIKGKKTLDSYDLAFQICKTTNLNNITIESLKVLLKIINIILSIYDTENYPEPEKNLTYRLFNGENTIKDAKRKLEDAINKKQAEASKGESGNKANSNTSLKEVNDLLEELRKLLEEKHKATSATEDPEFRKYIEEQINIFQEANNDTLILKLIMSLIKIFENLSDFEEKLRKLGKDILQGIANLIKALMKLKFSFISKFKNKLGELSKELENLIASEAKNTEANTEKATKAEQESKTSTEAPKKETQETHKSDEASKEEKQEKQDSSTGYYAELNKLREKMLDYFNENLKTIVQAKNPKTKELIDEAIEKFGKEIKKGDLLHPVQRTIKLFSSIQDEALEYLTSNCLNSIKAVKSFITKLKDGPETITKLEETKKSLDECLKELSRKINTKQEAQPDEAPKKETQEEPKSAETPKEETQEAQETQEKKQKIELKDPKLEKSRKVAREKLKDDYKKIEDKDKNNKDFLGKLHKALSTKEKNESNCLLEIIGDIAKAFNDMTEEIKNYLAEKCTESVEALKNFIEESKKDKQVIEEGKLEELENLEKILNESKIEDSKKAKKEEPKSDTESNNSEEEHKWPEYDCIKKIEKCIKKEIKNNSKDKKALKELIVLFNSITLYNEPYNFIIRLCEFIENKEDKLKNEQVKKALDEFLTDIKEKIKKDYKYKSSAIKSIDKNIEKCRPILKVEESATSETKHSTKSSTKSNTESSTKSSANSVNDILSKIQQLHEEFETFKENNNLNKIIE